jgi:hypothetical protein
MHQYQHACLLQVPEGHTSFSWSGGGGMGEGGSCKEPLVPSGHTSFSWFGELRDLGGGGAGGVHDEG